MGIDPARLDAYDQRVAETIEQYGWMLQGVAPLASAPRSDGDLFTYSVGLTRFDHPELIIFGIGPENAAVMLNDMGEQIRGGRRYVPGPDQTILRGYTAELVEVDDSTEHLTMANRHFPEHRPVPALQIVWPDKDGRFPWDQGYAITPGIQPVLGQRAGGTQ